MAISFEGKVAIVTGAGGGLGRAHALELAKRGAKVVVNDLGGSRDGAKDSSSATAEAVVAEIEALGGIAMASGASVTDEQEVNAMVEATMKAWGRVDILINNAGILRDKTFHKMEVEDFSAVLDVHIMGAVNCTKAVWEIMRSQAYGRIVMTTSSSGLYGNFGQANYGAAKLGLVGFMNTLHLEGAKYNIKVNCLAPVAATRMTEDIIPENMLALLAPELVSPGVMYLVSDDAPSRQILSAGAGCFAVAKIIETDGFALKPEDATAENVAANWPKISDTSEQMEPMTGGEQTMKFLGKASIVQKQ
jgi:NAD(P)-dependent dehydrogenase (short-subunit alcohol dehydrogenase family)